ncbi:MAG TPA: G5 domain-containing protein [Anaerolineales bacterium]|nr:G5 domain-containing protein [Anaerolineales bacterium]
MNGLYQPTSSARSTRRTPAAGFSIVALVLVLAGCVGPQATAGAVAIVVAVDDKEIRASAPAGSTVLQAVEAAGVDLGELDRVDPPAYTLVTDGTRIEITRLVESFEIEQITLPFPQQTIRNDSLPEGETRLLQAGQNGLQEVTYRIVTEESVEISRTPVKSQVVVEPRPEIRMVGALTAYSPVPIDGTLAYVTSGNVWTISGDSGSRTPITIEGDADGRILEISPDRAWITFTRQDPEAEGEINSLWAVAAVGRTADPFPLGGKNIVHFADWSPEDGTLAVAYSTVEPRPAAPGWQANNDLILVAVRAEQDGGRAGPTRTLIPSNSGGAYGWWGSSFAWSDDGSRLAYARPDGVGVIEMDDPSLNPILEMPPYQTLGDWAWVPGISWGWDGRTLFTVNHAPPVGLETEASSPAFDLVVLQPTTGAVLPLRSRSGMFAEPVVSPPRVLSNGELDHRVAFLQALTPLESETSRYQLVVMDRDGSNARVIFPGEGEPGLESHRVSWSPDGERLALIYQGDLWIVDVASGQAQRLTSDGQVTAMDWEGA